MLNANAFANATASVAVGFFIVCRVVAWLAPDFLFQIGQSWVHTVELESTQVTGSFAFGPLLLGLVSAAVVTWVVTYVTVVLYNKWSEK